MHGYLNPSVELNDMTRQEKEREIWLMLVASSETLYSLESEAAKILAPLVSSIAMNFLSAATKMLEEETIKNHG